jgi:hypothetical protein
VKILQVVLGKKVSLNRKAVFEYANVYSYSRRLNITKVLVNMVHLRFHHSKEVVE